jgi:hypothetical protein
MPEEPSPDPVCRHRKAITCLVRIALSIALGICFLVVIGYFFKEPSITSFGDGISMAKPTVIVSILLSLSGFGLLTLSTRD